MGNRQVSEEEFGCSETMLSVFSGQVNRLGVS